MLLAVTRCLTLRATPIRVVGAARVAFIPRVILVCRQAHLPCMLSRTPVVVAAQADITVLAARALLLHRVVAMHFLTVVEVVQAAIILPAKAAFLTN